MKKDKNRVVILLTATIAPNGMLYTALQEPTIRLTQYIAAVKFYLQETNVFIVLAENTNTNSKELSTIQEIHKERFEYLTFNGNNYDKKLGKGFGEAQIIRHAISHSKFIKRNSYLIKITGRLIIKNISSIINPLLLRLSDNIIQFDFYHKCFINSTCFICPSQWLLKTVQTYENILDDTNGYYFEHMLYDSIIKTTDIFLYPITPPIIIGVSGTTNTPYINTPMKDRKLNNLSYLSEICNIKGNIIMCYWYKVMFYKSIYLNFLHRLIK